MKNKMNALILLVLFAACSASKTEENQTENATMEVVKEPVKAEGDDIVSAYMNLKDALVASDLEAAKKSSQSLHQLVMGNETTKEIADACIALASAEDLPGQRKAFQKVTESFIAHVKATGADQKLYVQFCPMAFNNTGGNWVSLSDEIRNPYFGERMLKCGKVEEEI
jgi:hypothetical protein